MKNYRYMDILGLLIGFALLSSCSSMASPTTFIPIRSSPSPQTSPTPTSTIFSPPPATAPAEVPSQTVVPSALNPDPQAGLDRDMAIANKQMAAACQSSTLAEAKDHAEAVVNTIGGPWGLWYGDGDGNGLINDPSDRRGVLPAGIIQSSANIDTAAQQLGWAIILYEQGDSQAKSQVEQLLGDISLWRNDPFAAWANVASAIEGTTLQHPLVAKLPGIAVREMARARLVLVKANSLQDAQAYACQALK